MMLKKQLVFQLSLILPCVCVNKNKYHLTARKIISCNLILNDKVFVEEFDLSLKSEVFSNFEFAIFVTN